MKSSSHSKNIVSCIFELYCCIQKLKCRFWFIGSNLHIVVLNQKENIVSQIVILLIPKWKYNLLLCHLKLLMCRFSFVFSGKENLRSAFYDFEMESIISSFSKKLKDDVCRHITRKPKQNMICIGDHVYTLQVETPQPNRENYLDRTGGMVLRFGWVGTSKQSISWKTHFGATICTKNNLKDARNLTIFNVIRWVNGSMG